MFSELIEYLKTDIWRIRARDLPRSRFFLIRFLRIVILSARGIIEDKMFLRASALTFYSLLSVVPVFGMLFGIAKGFGFEKTLEKQLYQQLEGQQEVITQIISFSNALLENTKGGLIAGIGIVILFWSIIKLLGHIESAFNDIWGVKKARSWGRKVSDYLSLMLITPVLFMMSSAATVLITSQVHSTMERYELLRSVGPAISFLLSLSPYITIWILFSFLYLFMPNTKVSLKSGALAGIIAGTMYHLFQWTYINFQINVAKYNAIYGSFAALPLFLVWLQISWMIVLLGAEIAFSHQNVDTYEFEPDCLSISHAFKRLLSLRVVQLLVREFSTGTKTWDDKGIAKELEVPIRLVRQILFELVESGVVSQVMVEEAAGGSAFQPAHNPDDLTIRYVVNALESRGSDGIPVAESEELVKLEDLLTRINDDLKKSPGNQRLSDI
jgi:membrane protein